LGGCSFSSRHNLYDETASLNFSPPPPLLIRENQVLASPRFSPSTGPVFFSPAEVNAVPFLGGISFNIAEVFFFKDFLSSWLTGWRQSVPAVPHSGFFFFFSLRIFFFGPFCWPKSLLAACFAERHQSPDRAFFFFFFFGLAVSFFPFMAGRKALGIVFFFFPGPWRRFFPCDLRAFFFFGVLRCFSLSPGLWIAFNDCV